MDYYAPWGPLLSIPPRTAYSTFDPRRDIIPDFTRDANPAESLRRWGHHVVYPDFPPSTWWQFRSSAICLCGLIAVCSMIIGRRLYERSFWIFRVSGRCTAIRMCQRIYSSRFLPVPQLVRRSKGVIIVCNAMISFTVFAGLFSIILIAMNFEMCKFYEAQSVLPSNLMAWVTLPWLAIKSAGVYAAWGTLYARPSALTSEIGRDSSQNRAQKFFTHPMLLNCLCFGPPIILDIAILVPSLLVNARWNSTINKYAEWRVQYAGAEMLSNDMLVGIQEIWYEFIQHSRDVAAIFTFWAVQALIIWMSYTFVGVKLLLTIRRQIITLESRAAAAGRSTNNTDRDGDDVPSLTRPMQERRGASDIEADDSSDRLDRIADKRENTSSNPSIALQPLEVPPTQEDQSASNYFTRQQMATDRPVPSFFPPVRPSKVVDGKELNKGNDKSSQAHYLRRVGVNFFVQCVAIDLAILMFAAIAIFGAIVAVPIFELNHQGAGLSRALLWASWNSVFFGLIVLGAIAGRVYEPVTFAASEAVPAAANKIKARSRRLSILKRGRGDSRRPPSWLGAVDQIQIHTTYTESSSPITLPTNLPPHHPNAVAAAAAAATTAAHSSRRDPRSSTSTRASSLTEPLEETLTQGPRYKAPRYFSRGGVDASGTRRSSDATFAGSEAATHKTKEVDEGQAFVDSLPLPLLQTDSQEVQVFEPALTYDTPRRA